MVKVSLVVITLNEEKNIRRCLESVPFAVEMLVVDSGSTDKTKEIAESLGAKVIHHDWEGYGRQKQFAIDSTSNDWVLLLDADEYLTGGLIKEIPEKLKTANASAYELPIHQIFMNRLCGHGKAVSWPVRLYNKREGRYDLKNIHEAFVSKGKTERLSGVVAHNSATTVPERLEKILRDLRLEIAHNSANPTLKNVLLDPVRYFLSYYLKKRAYKDGIPGLVLTILFAFQIFVQNASHYEKKFNA